MNHYPTPVPSQSGMATKQLRFETMAHYTVEPSSAARNLTDDEIVRLAEPILYARLERGEALTDPASAGRYCTAKLRGHTREVFAVLLLDSRHRVIGYEELFYGTIDGCEVHPREVVRTALLANAAAVIITHNHPSGSNEPSAADRAVTGRLKEALALVDIRLIDHFVVGDGAGAAVSLAARGWI